jgi:hypothetical protein
MKGGEDANNKARAEIEILPYVPVNIDNIVNQMHTTQMN